MTATSTPTLPAIGTLAPDFTLPSTSGEPVTLSALRGRPVLLAFFPLAFTSTCTDELCEMRDDHDRFVQRDLVVLPISVDSTATLREFKVKYSLATDLLSDFFRDVSRAYGVLNEEKFYARRSYFLIDREGIVRWAHVETVSGQRRSDEEILTEVERL